MNKWEYVINQLKGDLPLLFNKDFSNVFKECPKCKFNYPSHPLFFKKVKYGDGLDGTCKECRGRSFISNGTHVIFKHVIRDNQKICSDCNEIYLNSPKYFTKDYSKCKECLGKPFGVPIEYLNSKLKIINKKKCSYCKNIKKLDEFSRYSNRINSFCFECESLYKAYKSSYDRLYYINNKSKKQEYFQTWLDSGGREIKRINGQKRLSLKKNTFADLSIDDWNYSLKFFNESCAYCGLSNEDHKIQFYQRLHQDHIVPLSRGGAYSDFNIIPSCLTCNDSKNNRDLEDYYLISEKFTLERYIKIIDYILDQI